MDAQVRVVRFLDGATNTTKTGYVIDGMAYEDQAGTIPVSDYSRFTTADGVLQIKTPYGVMRSADFARLLEYQSRYDTETFGEAIINKNGDIIGSVNFTGRRDDRRRSARQLHQRAGRPRHQSAGRYTTNTIPAWRVRHRP